MTVANSRSATVTLPADEQILITREFDAPRHLVYEAWTTPELVRRWWHANRGEMTVAEIDLRVGGRWRYAMVTPEGHEVAFHGEYREIVPDERLVHTEVYESPETRPGEEGALNIVTFAEARRPHGGHGADGVRIEGAARPDRRVRDGGRPAGRARPARAGRGLPPLSTVRGRARPDPSSVPLCGATRAWSLVRK